MYLTVESKAHAAGALTPAGQSHQQMVAPNQVSKLWWKPLSAQRKQALLIRPARAIPTKIVEARRPENFMVTVTIENTGPGFSQADEECCDGYAYPFNLYGWGRG